MGTGLSLPDPVTRTRTSINARGVVFGPARPRIAEASGVSLAIGGRPAASRVAFSASRVSRGASETKKSLQEYASASAGDSGRLRSGCEQAKVWPSALAARRHMRDEPGVITPLSSAATSAIVFTIDPGSTGVSRISGRASRRSRGLSRLRVKYAAP